MGDRALDAGMLGIVPVFLLSLAAGAPDDGGAVVEDQDVARVAPVRRGAGADVGDEVAGDPLVRSKHEDAFGMGRREFAPAGRRAGLVQHRRALPRWLRQVDRIHLVVGAAVAHAMDPRGVGELPRGLVAQYGALFPAGLP